MRTQGIVYRTALAGAAVAALLVGASSVGAQARPVGAQPSGGATADANASYWTPARRAAAEPRDLVVDRRGLGYLERSNGALEPYGHSVAASSTPVLASAPGGSTRPQAGPPSNGDGEAPVVSDVDPDGITIGATYGFGATVTDNDGIKSVDFVLTQGSSSTSFPASLVGTDRYGVTFDFTPGLADGPWSWTIVARDNSRRGGTVTTAGPYDFTVDTGGAAPPTTEPPPTTQPPTGSCENSGGTVENDPWTCGGQVQTATGRIYFEMPANRRGNRWNGYVCSGTAVDDQTQATSIILTAAHCVYDDVNKAFARNVLFIPDQAGTTGSGTDLNCSNDPLGCWSPSYGVVDRDWTTRTFPANIPYDYAYYVVPDTGAHTGAGANGSLAEIAGTLPIRFSSPVVGDRAHALGYSYSDDPNFMYCAEDLATESSYGDYWLAHCGLSGGSSGGPWIQPMDESSGSGPIISLNSWGYSGSPGMGGPPLTTSAACVFGAAQNSTLTPVDGGIVATC